MTAPSRPLLRQTPAETRGGRFRISGGALGAKRRKVRSAERKSLKFQGDTGEDRRGGGGGGGGAGLISMKMRPPFQPLPYGCHDTLGAWRLRSYRAARLFLSAEEAPPAAGAAQRV